MNRSEAAAIFAPSSDENATLALQGSGGVTAHSLWRLGALQEGVRIDRKLKGAWSKEQALELRGALMECASAGYVPGDHAVLVPFWDRERKLYAIKPIVTRKGILARLQADGVTVFPPQVVFDGDKFSVTRTVANGSYHQVLAHEEAMENRGAPVGCYVVWSFGGFVNVEYKPKSHFDAVTAWAARRDKSTPRKGPFALEMWRNTMIRWVVKFVPADLPTLSGDSDDGFDSDERPAPPAESAPAEAPKVVRPAAPQIEAKPAAASRRISDPGEPELQPKQEVDPGQGGFVFS